MQVCSGNTRLRHDFDRRVLGASYVPGAGLGVGNVKRRVPLFQGASVWAVACNQIVFEVNCEIKKPFSHTLVTRSSVSGSEELW